MCDAQEKGYSDDGRFFFGGGGGGGGGGGSLSREDSKIRDSCDCRLEDCSKI